MTSLKSTPVSQVVRAAGFAHAWLDQGWATLDPTGCVLEADEHLCRWLDRSLSEVSGRPLWVLFKDYCSEWEAALQKTLLENSKTFAKIELQKEVVGNHTVQVFRLECTRHNAGMVVRISSMLPQVNVLEEAPWDDYLSSDLARREMFVRLMRAETQLKNLIQRWPGVIFSQRPDCSFSFISPRIEELTGIPAGEWHRQTQLFWSVLHEADANQMQQQLSKVVRAPNGLTSTFRIRHIKTGRIAYVLEHRQAVLSSNGLLLEYDGFWLDITRQTIAEKRLSSSAWKETLAVITMGLAHDFSNIMAGILALSETFQTELPKDHPFYEGLTLIRNNAIQASQLIQRISKLHRGKPGERGYMDLNEVATEMVELVQKIVPKRIAIKTEFSTAQLALYADVVEFRQVLLNLVLNAVEAMPNGGQLVIGTSRHEQCPSLTNVRGAFPRFPAACLSIADTGCGIPARHLNSIFDPFFTTKEVSKGSGLGLYNAGVFVEKHQGAISVESEEGKGTCFRLWLPEADFTEAERPAEVLARHTLVLLGVKGSALDSMAGLLRQNGFCVVVTSSGTDALEFLHSKDYHIAGVILQSTMAGCTIFRDIQLHKIPVKTILQVVSCNLDEIETKFLKRADLVIPADIPVQQMLDRIRSVLELPSMTAAKL